MTRDHRLSRRRFLAGTAASLAIPTLISADPDRPAASDRISVAVIGYGRRSVRHNLPWFLQAPDTQVVAICDVDSWRLEQGCKVAERHYAKATRSGAFKGCKAYRDYREILARDDIDVVMISTNDQWHTPMSIDAINAGKDVCCEKPITRTIGEGRMLSDLATAKKRVFRTDSEFRSLANFHRVCELVRNGRVGKLHTVRVAVPAGDVACGDEPTMPVPPELDYERWQGPAPRAPYTVKRVHPRHVFGRPGWMRVLHYCDGMITNWGTHLIDIAQWGLDADDTGPVEVQGKGVYPQSGLWNVLLSFEVEYRYANGVRMFYKTARPTIRFEGDKGWVGTAFGGPVEASSPEILNSVIGPDEIHFPRMHEKRDLINAVKTRGRTLEDAEVGHRTTSVCHLGHIAIQRGKKLRWDPKAEQFHDDDEANRMVREPIHAPVRA